MFILVCLHFKNEKRKDDKFSHGNKEISENYYEVKNYATISKKLGKTKRMRKYINFADFFYHLLYISSKFVAMESQQEKIGERFLDTPFANPIQIF